jgi:hypothetical protein
MHTLTKYLRSQQINVKQKFQQMQLSELEPISPVKTEIFLFLAKIIFPLDEN